MMERKQEEKEKEGPEERGEGALHFGLFFLSPPPPPPTPPTEIHTGVLKQCGISKRFPSQTVRITRITH